MTRALIGWVVLLGGVAHADGGTLRLSRPSGPFVISLFTAPEPLRTGPADLSVLVQTGDGGAVVLDAGIDLRLRAPDGTEQRIVATHDRATNRLLSAANVEIPTPGRWLVDVTVRRGDREATVAGALDVAAAAPRLAAQWPALTLPLLCIALFLWRQRLRRRAGGR